VQQRATCFENMEMQAASAPKDSDNPGSALNWRQRKAAIARRQQAADEAAARRPQLIAAYVDALGGADRINPIQMTDIERCVDLILLARDMRAAVRHGTAKVADLTRLEGAADRAVRRLNLPAPGSGARVMTLDDHIAANYATTQDEEEA
jgi:hypothetical protein